MSILNPVQTLFTRNKHVFETLVGRTVVDRNCDASDVVVICIDRDDPNRELWCRFFLPNMSFQEKDLCDQQAAMFEVTDVQVIGMLALLFPDMRSTLALRPPKGTARVVIATNGSLQVAYVVPQLEYALH